MINDVIYNRLCDFDEYSRDKDGNDCSDKALKQFVENIILDNALKVNDKENYIKYLLRINNKIYDAQKYKFLFYRIYGNPNKRVSAYMNRDIIKQWKNKNSVFILAGTGKGKNYFIKNGLIDKYPKRKIVIFVNRQTLLRQQKEIIKKCVSCSDDIIQGFKTNGLVMLNNKTMLISYQKAALSILTNDKKVVKFLSKVKYAVFDEVHYLLDDSLFNKGVNIIVDNLIDKNSTSDFLPNAVKIFMSATMEEMLLIFRKYKYIFEKYDYFVKTQKKDSYIKKYAPKNYILNLPTDYRYIEPCMYSDVYDLIDTITDSNEKWLIFVDSKSVGEKLCDEINNKIGSKEKDEAVFINADNKDNDRFQTIINNERFEERVLIATSVIYNGVNLKDDDLKNIVLPFVNVPMAKQMIGRKRINDGDKVKVYFKNVDLTTIKQAFVNNVNNYLDIMVIEGMDINYATGVLNGLIKVRDEFLYFNYNECILKLTTNRMACQKLHFDSMFLLYTLQKISKQQDSSYARIMLEHLGIGKKYAAMKENAILSKEEKKEKVRSELNRFLSERVGENIYKLVDGKYLGIADFNYTINHLYCMYNGGRIDDQYKNETRFIPAGKINEFINDLDLPFEIETPRKNNKSDEKILLVKRKI